MRKTAILILAAMLLAALPAGAVSAAESGDTLSADITVNLANGELILTGEQIAVTDADSDGALTVGDALICLHDAKYEGGAEAGFAASSGFISKLWGVVNGGGYGYYVNNVSAMSLTDPIKGGDTLYAFIYTDLDFWSDCYTFFDVDTVSAAEGDSVTLTLNKSSMWYPAGYTMPVEDAVITIDGEETEYTTDDEGKVTLTLDQAGKHIISAVSEDEVLVPPVCFAAVTAAESGEPLSADITVSVANGTLVVAGEQITVTDADSDGKLTVGDALICVHDAKYEGGAAAGFATVEGQFGAMITKLWGVENGGSYSYFVNNASAMGLNDPIKTGDSLYAYVITDLSGYSDAYTYFDKDAVSGKEGDSVRLTLSKMAYDENWNAVALPVAGATITVDGVATKYKTDAEGKVTVKLNTAGRHVISIAPVEGSVLVPPVCVANVEPVKNPTPAPTGDLTASVAVLGLLTVVGGAWVCRRRSRDDA